MIAQVMITDRTNKNFFHCYSTPQAQVVTSLTTM